MITIHTHGMGKLINVFQRNIYYTITNIIMLKKYSVPYYYEYLTYYGTYVSKILRSRRLTVLLLKILENRC